MSQIRVDPASFGRRNRREVHAGLPRPAAVPCRAAPSLRRGGGALSLQQCCAFDQPLSRQSFLGIFAATGLLGTLCVARILERFGALTGLPSGTRTWVVLATASPAIAGLVLCLVVQGIAFVRRTYGRTRDASESILLFVLTALCCVAAGLAQCPSACVAILAVYFWIAFDEATVSRESCRVRSLMRRFPGRQETE